MFGSLRLRPLRIGLVAVLLMGGLGASVSIVPKGVICAFAGDSISCGDPELEAQLRARAFDAAEARAAGCRPLGPDSTQAEPESAPASPVRTPDPVVAARVNGAWERIERRLGAPIPSTGVVWRSSPPSPMRSVAKATTRWAIGSGRRSAATRAHRFVRPCPAWFHAGRRGPSSHWMDDQGSRPARLRPGLAAGVVSELSVLVSSGERYAYRFSRQQVDTVRRRLACGDYAIEAGGWVQAAVERKSLPDLVASLLDSRLGDQLAELAALPHAAVVVEDRYSQVFKLDHVRPAVVADGIAELQVAFPVVPIVFCETRQLAEEWTYRFLAAAYAVADHTERPPAEPTTAEVRRWAREHGFEVPDRGRLGRVVLTAYHHAHEGDPDPV
ncbi:hypothetical protein GCM10022419_035960 [Nonomuraea rosea]|uniref:ERCC4 domain-containing protein n=1 Tax=Nonomuraea rosea TaxID=638574 RepID=A0ABP6WMH4_9ACTN